MLPLHQQQQQRSNIMTCTTLDMWLKILFVEHPVYTGDVIFKVLGRLSLMTLLWTWNSRKCL